MLNVGLVGFGFAGKTFHAPVIRVVEGLRLTTIVQRHGGGAPDPRYADVEFVSSVDELLARVTMYESHLDRFRPELRPGAWREQSLPGSGVWFDLGAHLLDQALVLFGTPQAISADIRTERDGAAADDAFDVTLHYRHMRALLRGSMLVAAPGPTFAVHGTKGSYIKYGLDPQEAALKAGRVPDEPDWDAEPSEVYGELTGPEDTRTIPTIPSSFRHYYENVRDAILGKAQLVVTPEQARNVLSGLELAAASSQQRCVVPWSAST